MKFNEKLIELRKKEGLSQEELGYKLNVTRQTISKWELGQTTPEMEKLSEISNIFGISVDKLINEAEEIKKEKTENPIIEDQAINNNPKNSKIGIILIIAIVILLICGVFSIFNKKKTEENTKQGFFDRIFSIFDQASESQKEMQENAQNIIGNAQDRIENANSEMEKNIFNATFNGYNGTKSGYQIKNLLENVITSNKTKDRKVTVKYLETETQDPEEIKNLKIKFDDSKNFEVSFEYDENGYINEVKMERVYTEFEISSFNNSFEIFAGTKMGASVISVLDDIITNNKTGERKITVKSNNKETQDETEIRNIKRKIDSFTKYELIFEYDENGFINKAIIEK